MSLALNSVRCGFLFVYPTWVLLRFLDLSLNVFHQIWEVFGHYLPIFFLSCDSHGSTRETDQ